MDDSRKSGFRLRRKPGIFIYCLLLAAVIWVLHTLSEVHETELTMQLLYGEKKNEVNSNHLPSSGNVVVRGTGWKIIKTLFEGRVLHLDLNTVPEQQTFLPNNYLFLFTGAPEGISIVHVDPDTIRFSFEEKVSKKIPVILNREISFAPAHDILPPVLLRPDSITITGPKSAVEKYNYWETETVTGENIDTDKRGSVPLITDEGENIRLSNIAVSYIIHTSLYIEKEYRIPVTIPKNHGLPVKANPAEVIIHCLLPVNGADSIRESSFQIVAYPNRRYEGSNLVPLELIKWPVYARDITFSPKNIEYYLIDYD